MNKLFVILSLLLLLVSSCSSIDVNQEDHNETFTVTTSFYPIYFFAKAIGGEKTQVINMTPAGVEPHDFEPSVQDRLIIEKSDMFVINGWVEIWWEKLIPSLEQKGITSIVSGKDAMSRKLNDWEDEEWAFAGLDPHIWLSPKQAKVMARNILDGYLESDRKNDETYKANALALEKRLHALDGEYVEVLKNCERKDLVTSHAAFGYLALDYGLNQIPLAGISPEEEPSAKDIADMVNTIRQKNITAIFSETLVSPRLSETVAKETGARMFVLNPLEWLTEEELSSGEDYFSIMKKNLSTLKEALSCNK